MAQNWSEETLFAALLDTFGTPSDALGALEKVKRWWERGDGCAVYQNEDLGHPEVGHKVFMSYGSSDAQWENFDPPTTLPDGLFQAVTGGINWRYQLVAVSPAPCEVEGCVYQHGHDLNVFPHRIES